MPVQQIAVTPAEGRVGTNVKKNSKSKAKPSPMKKKEGAKETLHPDSPTPKVTERCESRLSLMSSGADICRICHCESEPDAPLIGPCLCAGSMKYVHQACLQRWIKSSENKACELCKFDFIMSKKIKPFKEWERLNMTAMERRKITCSVTFHIIAITCVIWSLYVLIDRTTQEVRDGMLEWPFWTKLIVVVIGFSGGLVFMYVQCKMYVHLCRRWRTYNEVIIIENAPQKCKIATVMNGKVGNSNGDTGQGMEQFSSQSRPNTPSSVNSSTGPAVLIVTTQSQQHHASPRDDRDII